jgi:glycosyltransferase involved in cell wall biosynthesis
MRKLDIFKIGYRQKIETVPKYAVLLPCNKDDNFLYQAIDSVLEDVPRSCDVFIVVHRNSDLYLKIKSVYQNGNVKVLSDETSNNLSEVLNFGLSLMEADYVYRMDSDDIWMKGRFISQQQFALKHSEIDVIGGQIDVIDEFNKFLYPIVRETTSKFFETKLNYECVIAHPSVMFKRESVLKVGGYDCRLLAAEDFDLWSRMRDKNYKFMAVTETVLKYRIHPRSQSKLKSQTQRNETNHIIARNLGKFFGIQIIDCRHYSHNYGSEKICAALFFYLRVKRKILVTFLHKENNYLCSFLGGFNQLSERTS